MALPSFNEAFGHLMEYPGDHGLAAEPDGRAEDMVHDHHQANHHGPLDGSTTSLCSNVSNVGGPAWVLPHNYSGNPNGHTGAPPLLGGPGFDQAGAKFLDDAHNGGDESSESSISSSSGVRIPHSATAGVGYNYAYGTLNASMTSLKEEPASDGAGSQQTGEDALELSAPLLAMSTNSVRGLDYTRAGSTRRSRPGHSFGERIDLLAGSFSGVVWFFCPCCFVCARLCCADRRVVYCLFLMTSPPVFLVWLSL